MRAKSLTMRIPVLLSLICLLLVQSGCNKKEEQKPDGIPLQWDMDFHWLLYPSPGNYFTVYYDRVLDSPVTVKIKMYRLLDKPDTNITVIVPGGHKKLAHKEYTPHDRIRNFYIKNIGNDYYIRAIDVEPVKFGDNKKYLFDFPADGNQLDYKTSVSFVSNGVNIAYTDYTTYTYHTKNYYNGNSFDFDDQSVLISYMPAGVLATGQQSKLSYFSFVWKGKTYSANSREGQIDMTLKITRIDKEKFDADFSGKCWPSNSPNPDTLYITNGKIVNAKLPE